MPNLFGDYGFGGNDDSPWGGNGRGIDLLPPGGFGGGGDLFGGRGGGYINPFLDQGIFDPTNRFPVYPIQPTVDSPYITPPPVNPPNTPQTPDYSSGNFASLFNRIFRQRKQATQNPFQFF